MQAHCKPLRVKGFLYFILALLMIPGSVWSAAAQDSLLLYNPQNIVLDSFRSAAAGQFVVAVTFDDIPDSLGAFIGQPDLSNWSFATPGSLLSEVRSLGHYNGSIDRTVSFRALDQGAVGDSSSINILYEIRGEEIWTNKINVGTDFYSPGDSLPVYFINGVSGDTLDLGLKLSFSRGIIDSNGTFLIGLQDFEGYHVWRGTYDGDGNLFDISIIGELSKEEAFDGDFCDSLYFDGILPELRNTGTYFFDPGVECFTKGKQQRLDLQLQDNQLFWLDINAFNGFKYGYAVSTFDRGYEINSGRQGLFKIDSFEHCFSDSIKSTLPCNDLFVEYDVQVNSRENLRKTYVVPNPFRTGGSAFTTPNYQNYPDGVVRFVNVPTDCRILVYSTAGDFVWKTEHHSSSGNIEWNTKNAKGREVTSGIYIYKIENEKGGSIFGKLVIIR